FSPPLSQFSTRASVSHPPPSTMAPAPPATDAQPKRKRPMAINESKLNDFMGKAVGDLGAAMSACLAMIGDRLGLYKAMAGAGPMTPAQLATKSGTAERYCREWLLN